ncbi:MAG TPA: class III extradiol ring-cleavage dioxygenase [Fibrobacteraceae bacterium]|nr:class III extradiol ring-cleavage dioxygenase [Fibrobacteraceae bacterium]
METTQKNNRGTVVYLSHGGGPLPILGDPGHERMISFLKALPQRLKKPEAIIVISAHWEKSVPTIIGGERPPLLYDYYGFPEEAYSIKYPVQGNPTLAKRVQALLSARDIESDVELRRGFDHGVFEPLKMMYPGAGIPAIQISLISGLDPERHILMGSALKELLEENVLIIGSGFSFHNLGAFRWNDDNRPDKRNDGFQDWLIDVCTGGSAKEEKEGHLKEWEKAPNARYCHPREEHLLPLHVCFGMSDGPAEVIFDDYILGKRSVALQWKRA